MNTITTEPNTTTAQQSGPSDSSIAQAFREMCADKFLRSSLNLANKIEKRARELDASAPAAAVGGVPDIQRWTMAKGSDGARWSVYMDHSDTGEWCKWSEVQQKWCLANVAADQATPAAQSSAKDGVRVESEGSWTGQALHDFTEYFVKNYPGPDTVICDPKWHAPRIFRNALWHIEQAQKRDAEATTAAGLVDGETVAVLERLRAALPTVGLNGWMDGVKAIDVVLAANGSEVEK